MDNRFFREMYQDVICKWVGSKQHSKSSLCQPCMVDVMDFYKFKLMARRNIPKSIDEETKVLPEVKESLLDGCKEEIKLPQEVLQGLDPSGPHMGPVERNAGRTKKVYRKRGDKTEEEKAMTPEEYKRHYNRTMWARYRSVCSICGKKIVHSRFEGHMNGHMGLEPYSCPHCNLPFNCRMNMLGHIKRMHTVQLPCEICGKVVNGQLQFKRHMLDAHSGRIFECTICKRKFKQKRFLKNHMAAVHSDRRDHICTLCGKGFYRKYVLDIHMRTHTREEAYRCEVCLKGFVHRRMYVMHMEKEHPGGPAPTRRDGTLRVKQAMMKRWY